MGKKQEKKFNFKVATPISELLLRHTRNEWILIEYLIKLMSRFSFFSLFHPLLESLLALSCDEPAALFAIFPSFLSSLRSQGVGPCLPSS